MNSSVPAHRTNGASTEQTFALAILVPTFERKSQLLKLLGQLGQELGPVAGRVIVQISNNASRDGTDEAVHAFMAEHENLAIEYFQQLENIGPIRNLHFLVERSRGRFSWAIGDDDLLVAGALERIVAFVLEAPPNLLLVRAVGISEWETIPWGPESGFSIINTCEPKAGDYAMAASFLASVVVESEEWKRLLPIVEPLRDTAYSNWAAVILLLQASEVFAVCDDPCVHGNASMVGPARILSYHVLVLGRLRVWNSLAVFPLREALLGHMLQLYRSGWVMAAAGLANDLPSKASVAWAWVQGWRLLGWRSYSVLPFALAAFLVPNRMQTALYRGYRALRRRLRWSAGGASPT